MNAQVPVPRPRDAAEEETSRLPDFPARRPLLLGMLTLAVLGAGLFGWGTLTTIAGAVIAVGRVEVKGRDQIVEHVEGGTVKAVLARDGDRVAAGQVLLLLDGTRLRSEAAVLAAEADELAGRRNRLEAEFRDTGTIDWDRKLAARAATDPAVAAILDSQRRLFSARRASRAGEAERLRQRIGQTRKQIEGLQAQTGAVSRQRGFAERELAGQRALFSKGLVRLDRLMALEREAARLDGQAGDIAARIAGARGRIAEFEVLLLQIDTRRVEEAEAEAREAQAKENRVRERLAAVRARLHALTVRAPVAGEVFEMTVFGAGEVVRPGEPILKVVPAEAELVVRARLDPIHVDQIRAGQEAVLRFPGLSAHTTPEYGGQVVRVSADALKDSRTGMEWFEVDLALGAPIEAEGSAGVSNWLNALPRRAAAQLPEDARAWLGRRAPDWFGERRPTPVTGKDDAGITDVRDGPDELSPGRALALAPGMPVEVHVRSGDRTPLSYLVKPLTDYFSRALREE